MSPELQNLFDIGLRFHGHKCPAMPMGLRAGLAALKVLGVERAQNKELMVQSETGKGHAAGCFLDGIMTATGCIPVAREYFATAAAPRTPGLCCESSP